MSNAPSGRFDSLDLERLIRARTGLVFGEDRRATLIASLERQMKRHGITDPEIFRDLLASDGDTLSALVEDLTIGETYFFREFGQFEFIRHQVIPRLVAGRKPGHRIRAWSAGCATGEEAYSLAILLREVGHGRFEVQATDISGERLDRARAGRYRAWSFRGVPERTMRTYFRQTGSVWHIDPAIRETVQFRELNLLQFFPADLYDLDLILCRNVLIYLDRDSISVVADRLLRCLSPDGWLFLGASDPLLTEYVECDVVVTGAGIAYRRRGTARDSEKETPRETSESDGADRKEAAAPAARVRRTGSGKVRLIEPGERAAVSIDIPPSIARGAQSESDGVIARVRLLADRGEHEEARSAAAAALARYPDSAELWYLHGLLLAQTGQRGEALASTRRALYLDHRFIPAHLGLGSLLVQLGDAVGARRSFSNAERLLAVISAAELVPGSGGEFAGRLLSSTRLQLKLLDGPA